MGPTGDIEAEKRKGRSRLSNGFGRLPDSDGRSMWARRLRDVMALHLSDLGGADNASEAEKSIIRRIATITIEMERLEAKFAKAGRASKADLDLYQRTAGNLRRLIETVGIKRRAREIVPTIEGYLSSKGRAA